MALGVGVDSGPVADHDDLLIAERQIQGLERRAAGLPGGGPLEVGLIGEGWRDQRGRPRPAGELAIRRALGGLEYPCERDRLVETAKAELRGRPLELAWLERLPSGTYALPDEAWLALRAVGP